MTDHTPLERRYRRLLACYPRSFRHAHEEEMLVILLACTPDGRRWPGVADAVNLLWHALALRVAPPTRRTPPSVVWGVRLMVLSAALELVAAAIAVASQGAVAAAVLRHFPAMGAAHVTAAVHDQVAPVMIGAPIAAALWLVVAWANDRGHRWARGGSLALFGLTCLSLLTAASRQAATYASLDLIAGGVLCLVGLAASLLIIATDSNRHYRPGGSATSGSGDQCDRLQNRSPSVPPP